MRIVVVAVGKVKQKPLRAAIDDYIGRLERYAKVREVELKDAAPGPLRARFDRAVPDRARVVALDRDGEAWTSEQLARWIGRAENDGVQSLVFLIGGADGLPPEVSRAADIRLSLSAMTLPHRLARLVLAEQLYRAYTILNNEPYSH